MEKLRWAPKLHPDRLARLYRLFMAGQADEALADDVGWALYLRCADILLVAARKCRCPRCRAEFAVTEGQNACPGGCGFVVSGEQYHQSWRHTDLWCGNARACFERFCAAYPRAQVLEEKMILIDTLIHSFHIDLKTGRANRSAANNLLQGSLGQVVDALDALSGVQPEKDDLWRNTVEDMWRRRRGKEKPE
jgi:hypothetical protein